VEPSPPIQLELSLYDLIKATAEKAPPNSPIDESLFPKIGLMDGGISFAAGALDALSSRFRNDGSEDEWEYLRNLFAEIEKGRIRNWKNLDERIKGRAAQATMDRVLESLNGTAVGRLHPSMFRELAQNSRNYEAVKWGIAIGALDANPEFVEDLLLFARHSEFTVHAIRALLRSYSRIPELKQKLLSLLPGSRGWGVIRLVEFLISIPAFTSDLSVQRDCLIYGMENNEGISMEIAFTLATHIDSYHFLSLSKTDGGVFKSFSQMMNTLLTEPNPLGGLNDLANSEALFGSYVELLEVRAPDNYVLMGLRAADEFLNDSATVWLGKEHLIQHVRLLLRNRASIDVLRAGLKDSSTRWVALKIIRENQVRSLVPDVEALFIEKPDSTNIDVLSELGELQHLQTMFVKISELVNLSERSARPMSKINVVGLEHQNGFEYAGIVKTLGRLGTPEAILHLKRAFRDYDPLVRAAACTAVIKMDRSKIDLEITGLIVERLDDSPKYVAEAALQTANSLGISASDTSSGKPN
jgi:hypothetical protein